MFEARVSGVYFGSLRFGPEVDGYTELKETSFTYIFKLDLM